MARFIVFSGVDGSGKSTQIELLKSRLEDMGYMVARVSKGSAALKILQTEWVDLVVSAVSLQGEMSGYKLFKDIKSKRKFSEIPIIMESSKSGMKGMFERMGTEAYFSKPYNIESLLDKVKSILAKRI